MLRSYLENIQADVSAGIHIGVKDLGLEPDLGGEKGKSTGMFILTWKTPPSYGVLAGPRMAPESWSSLSSSSSDN